MAYLELRDVSKSFPGVQALKDVSFSIRRGEVHALCGENGAGKSTLIKILSGIYPSGTYQGEVLIDGAPLHFHDIRDAERAGIAVIHQELALVQQMSIGENIFLGSPPHRMGLIDWDALYRASASMLHRLGLDIDPRTPVSQTGIGTQQLVEIAKALAKKADILILDEPTAALSEEETHILLRIIRKLKQEGVTCIYISHKLDEVLSLADNISVLRDGQYIGTLPGGSSDQHELVTMMVGRELNQFYPKVNHEKGETVLSARQFSTWDPLNPKREVVRKVDLDVAAGEILGIAGLMGAGRTELLMGLFGAWNGRVTGEVRIDGVPLAISSPSDAIERGLVFVTEDRKRFGLVLEAPVPHNLMLSSLRAISSSGILNGDADGRLCSEQAAALNIKVPHLQIRAGTLSGGNQQKVVLGKCLLTRPRVLLLDEPTRGIDVGAKHEIYQIMNRLVSEGMAIIMVSSDLPEVLGMSDRILVMHKGAMAAEFPHPPFSQEEIMLAATGHEKNPHTLEEASQKINFNQEEREGR